MLKRVQTGGDFETWRFAARSCISDGIPPSEIQWIDEHALQRGLDFDAEDYVPKAAKMTFSVPPLFVQHASYVAQHSSADRWHILYQILWELVLGQRAILEHHAHPITRQFFLFSKAVSHDAHKMKAFVRFRKVVNADGKEHFIAFHKSVHQVLPLVAPFFQRRFRNMSWFIVTPHLAAQWDQKKLSFSKGTEFRIPEGNDDWESMWNTYYAHIFNPARIKLKMMKKEMSPKYWSTMPETRAINQLLDDAPVRLEQMLAFQAPSIKDQTKDFETLEALNAAAKQCRHCPLHQAATQTVVGEGALTARMMLLGEQPGNDEDLLGKPFVGPAGELLNQVLGEVGIDRSETYVTNAVKHFKWKPGPGKTRIHQRPSTREASVCQAWLDAELRLLKPKLILCLGLTAAQAVLGRLINLSQEHAKVFERADGTRILCTYHPAAILRAGGEEEKQRMYAQLKTSLEIAKKLVDDACT